MTRLRPKPHMLGDRVVVEVLNERNELLGVIYPEERGVKIVSKYIQGRNDVVRIDPVEPPAVIVNLA